MKIPHARVNAVEASFPTLVLTGKVFFNSRLTQASGGSNSALALALLPFPTEGLVGVDTTFSGSLGCCFSSVAVVEVIVFSQVAHAM